MAHATTIPAVPGSDTGKTKLVAKVLVWTGIVAIAVAFVLAGSLGLLV